MDNSSKEAAKRLYERLAGIRVDRAVLTHAIEEACGSNRLTADSDDIAERLDDEDYASVLYKDVTDVVVLVTGALEAPTHTVYRDMVMHAERQASFEPFDEVSTALRQVVARNMAETGLEEMLDGPARKTAILNLRYGLHVLGDEDPFHVGEELPSAASA